jgi:hypothetical protein
VLRVPWRGTAAEADPNPNGRWSNPKSKQLFNKQKAAFSGFFALLLRFLMDSNVVVVVVVVVMAVVVSSSVPSGCSPSAGQAYMPKKPMPPPSFSL